MDDSTLESNYLEKWGFDVETVYKWALRFYKGSFDA